MLHYVILSNLWQKNNRRQNIVLGKENGSEKVLFGDARSGIFYLLISFPNLLNKHL